MPRDTDITACKLYWRLLVLQAHTPQPSFFLPVALMANDVSIGAFQSYESLISEILEPLNKELSTKVMDVQSEIDEFVNVDIQLDVLAARNLVSNSIKTLTDIGNGYRMQARIDATSPICVRVGCVARGSSGEQSIFLEMTSLEEAKAYVSSKLVHLRKVLKQYEDKSLQVFADLRSAQLALSALSQSRGTG